MEIVKSKRKSKCWGCRKPINQKYKVIWSNNNFHLSCIFKYLKRRLETTKSDLKEFSKVKYKKQMILEGLE